MNDHPDPSKQAQQWHDTDHGFLVGVDPTVHPGMISACWCCCEACDPDWNQRSNPFWGAAAYQQLMRGTG